MVTSVCTLCLHYCFSQTPTATSKDKENPFKSDPFGTGNGTHLSDPFSGQDPFSQVRVSSFYLLKLNVSSFRPLGVQPVPFLLIPLPTPSDRLIRLPMICLERIHLAAAKHSSYFMNHSMCVLLLW